MARLANCCLIVICVLALAQTVRAQSDTCDLVTCLQPLQQYSAASGIMSSSVIDDIDAVCSTFDSVKTCVDGTLSNCDADLRRTWTAINDQFTYYCSSEGKEKLQAYAWCYKVAGLGDSVKTCSRVAKQAAGVDTCIATNVLLLCVRSATTTHCNAEIAAWQDEQIRKALQPTLDTIGCTLGCSSVQLSLVLLMTSLLAFVTLQW